MNILYVTQPHVFGGAEIELMHILQHLDAKKFNATVAFLGEGATIDVFKARGIATKKVCSRPWRIVRRRLSDLLKDNNINIVCTNTPRIFEAALVANLSGIPHIWHMHCRLDSVYPNLKPAQSKQILGIIRSLSARVIACSRYVKAQFEECGLGRKVVIVNNGIDMSIFRPSLSAGADRFRRAFGIEKSALLIGMVGRLDPQKKAEEFIEAASIVIGRYPGIKFVLVGGTSGGGYIDTLRKANRKNGNPVIFAGHHDRIVDVMRSIDVLVLPSVNEASPLVILEAMACGKPVIAASSGGIPEIILEGKTGLSVPPDNPLELAKAISKIIDNPSGARRMGQTGRMRVERLYNIKKTVKELESVYCQVLRV